MLSPGPFQLFLRRRRSRSCCGCDSVEAASSRWLVEGPGSFSAPPDRTKEATKEATRVATKEPAKRAWLAETDRAHRRCVDGALRTTQAYTNQDRSLHTASGVWTSGGNYTRPAYADIQKKPRPGSRRGLGLARGNAAFLEEKPLLCIAGSERAGESSDLGLLKPPAQTAGKLGHHL